MSEKISPLVTLGVLSVRCEGIAHQVGKFGVQLLGNETHKPRKFIFNEMGYIKNSENILGRVLDIFMRRLIIEWICLVFWCMILQFYLSEIIIGP